MNDMIIERTAQADQAAQGADKPPVLVYENVRKTYGDFVALNGVSLQVNKGEVMCLIGPSGSGKSTLLRCTNALEKLDGGRVLLDGAVVPDTEPEVQRVRQRMGMVFQSFELFPHKSALDNVAMGPITVLGMAPEAARTRAMAAGKGGPGGQGRQLPGQPVRRPAAARGHRPRAGDGARGDAVRRTDVRAGSRDRGRSAQRDEEAGAGRHDHDRRDP